MRNSTDANATATTMIPTLASPFLAYEFPCSYLGNPRPIQSALPFAALGALLPPVKPLEKQNGSNSAIATASHNVTRLPPKTENENEPSSPWLSCPRRTIDGIASATILESEKNVASLESATATQALAVEVWFSPAELLERNGKEERLVPIVSIATPVAERNETLHNDGSSSSSISSIRHDLCDGTQLMIGQRGEYLELRYRDHYEYLPERFFEYDDDDDDFFNDESATSPPLPQYSCRVLRLTQWKLGDDYYEEERAGAVQGLHHLVVAWKDSGSVLQVFGNGNPIVDIDLLQGDQNIETNPGADFLRHWDPSFCLQVFSDSPRWFETRVATNANNKAVPTSTGNNDIGFNNTNDKVLFPGAIHKIALFKQSLHEDTVKSLYEVGVEKREDPFKTFFEDPNNPFEPLLLIALSASSAPEEESYDDGPFRGVVVNQGSSVPISVGASDDSNTTTVLWDVFVELVDLPKYGNLVYYNETKDPWESEYHVVTARIGDRFLIEEGMLRTQLEYRHLREDYFSVPKYTYHGTVLSVADLPGESFSYRLIATKKKKGKTLVVGDSASRPVVLGRSESIRQELTIVHKNHPPVLVGLPEKVLEPEWQPTGLGARPWATLGTNVVLNDEKDHDIDRVRLDLWAYEGTLTIDLENIEIQAIAEITACSNPKPTGLGRDWICDGINDRNMTLMATPTDVSKILSNLNYKALHWDTSDSIVLRIHDGPCPGEKDQQQTVTTIRDECFFIAASVNVPPLSKQAGGPSGNVWRDHRAWWISFVVFLTIISMTCCCAISCWRRCRKIKKLNDIAIADCDRHDVVLASPEGGFPSSLEITEKDQRAAANCSSDRHVTTPFETGTMALNRIGLTS
jgi:hypothetical protein